MHYHPRLVPPSNKVCLWYFYDVRSIIKIETRELPRIHEIGHKCDNSVGYE